MDDEPGERRGDRLIARLLSARWLVRAPIGLFRIGLGPLFGQRLLMLEHLGRTSGQRRYVVLECIDRPDPGVVVVASGFGAAAQWYRNIAANGHAFIWIGRLARVPSVPRLLPAEENAERLERYAARHPGAWRRLSGAMTVAQGGTPDIPLVEFTLDLAG